jgi:hypothetical protein
MPGLEHHGDDLTDPGRGGQFDHGTPGAAPSGLEQAVGFEHPDGFTHGGRTDRELRHQPAGDGQDVTLPVPPGEDVPAEAICHQIGNAGLT